ncbi:DUF2971 domain-containing protein [Leptospira wolffii]|uniref:DUF2971 domain-containing protein n=1 Tax=Leptospira wolffii TaxID=409998 RepID=UPI000352F9F7|nr:DUF2971 domain-containing protein [Leptospira wolffii]EPG67401.1 PF11185 family protein [Leptospira wolffii serovar Khorat str. Khorat-H2]
MRLYKYKPINEFTFKMIIDAEFYFAKPSEFNDPFDSRLNVFYRGSYEDWIDFFKRKGRDDAETKEIAKANADKIIAADSKEERKRLDDHNRVFCMSHVRDNILMWAHYSDQHKGICLGFEVTEVQDTKMIKLEKDDFLVPTQNFPRGYLSIFDIEYDNTIPPPMNVIKDYSSDGIFQFLLRKNECWKYEQESRILLREDWIIQNPVRFDRAILKEVIFGLRVSDTYKKIIQNIISKNYTENGYNPEILQCHESADNYQIEIR